jgi:hypothetical protein
MLSSLKNYVYKDLLFCVIQAFNYFKYTASVWHTAGFGLSLLCIELRLNM